MAKTVEEVMNRELFGVAPTERADRAQAGILALGIDGAPVLDGDRRPLGVVTLRDLVDAPRDALAAQRMSAPAVTVAASAPIADAAQRLAERGLHGAPVVDGDGRAVGFVATVDLLRALLGLPAAHPAVFPHLDAANGVTWSDDAVLDLAHVEAAPSAPGVLVLVHGGAGVVEQALWAEATHNLRTRVIDLLSGGAQEAPQIAHWLERGHLRFRCAEVRDDARRCAVASRVAATAQERARQLAFGR